MKKVLLVLVAILFSCGLYAQNSGINRVLLHQNDGTAKGFILNNVDSLTFAKVEGEVAANIELKDFSLEKLTLSITRTPACEGFKILLEAKSKISNMTDQQLAAYIDMQDKNIYYQDFENGELTGIEILPNTEYAVLTVGIDKYGVLCDVRKVEFTSPAEALVGNPQVTAELIEANLYDFTVKFTPNEDVSKYHVVAGEKGTLIQQYEQFAAWMGLTSIGDMITKWGVERTGVDTYQWKQQEPNKEYEVFIQAYDINGAMAPYQVFNLKTAELGGEGTAEVTITLGEYKLMEWSDENGNPVMLPSQFLTFTPNDQSAAYRLSVYTADMYDVAADTIKQELCSEPPMVMVRWFQYEELTTDFQIDPNTECVAIAAAKNINGEWGPVTELRFTTPADMPSKSKSNTIKERKVETTNSKGQVPVLKQATLTSK